MALGLTQPVTEMSTMRSVPRTDNLTTFMCRLSWNLGTSTSRNPQGLSRPVMGLFYLCLYIILIRTLKTWIACIMWIWKCINRKQVPLKRACLLVKVEKWKNNRYIQIGGMRSFSPAVFMIPLDTTELLEQVVLPLSINPLALELEI